VVNAKKTESSTDCAERRQDHRAIGGPSGTARASGVIALLAGVAGLVSPGAAGYPSGGVQPASVSP
jgi:hypothetical protein